MYYTESIPKYRNAEQINTAMAEVYANMALAVAISMITSWLFGNSPELLQFFFTGITKWVVIFSPLVAGLGISWLLPNVKTPGLARALLVLFSALMGLSFATIFAVYTTVSIITAFMGAAILFGVMSIYGYFTKKSLESIGQFLTVGLIAIVVASVINIFIGNTVLQTVISALAIIIFAGLTAWHTQSIRDMVSLEGVTPGATVLGALTLYLDFINIFLSLLQLIGDKKE